LAGKPGVSFAAQAETVDPYRRSVMTLCVSIIFLPAALAAIVAASPSQAQYYAPSPPPAYAPPAPAPAPVAPPPPQYNPPVYQTPSYTPPTYYPSEYYPQNYYRGN